ncbi:MAG TPA: 2,5-diketo-D-gluconic acid reductase [Spirochaetaceae bacterium]|nr:2,5-diketo-D-gluconic acid reductase [Spirochaetaceae bacterium]
MLVENILLNDGVRMPVLGFGTYRLSPNGPAYEAVSAALAAGYRHIDTAAMYMNEEDVGRAIRNSSMNREHVFVTSKVWLQDMGYAQTGKAIEGSLRRLGTDYIDLYLIHQPYGDIEGAWKAMEKARDEGKIRSIGVSNITAKMWHAHVLQAGMNPSVNQVEFNPYSQQRSVRKEMAVSGCVLSAWASLARADKQMMSEPVIVGIARKHSKTPAQVVIRFILQEGVVPLVKSASPVRMEENIDVFNFRLDDADMLAIRALDKGHPVRDPDDPATFKYLVSRHVMCESASENP